MYHYGSRGHRCSLRTPFPLCDEWIKIPLMGKIESLNVSVAAGILIYEAVKQRGFTEDKTASAL